MLKMIHLLAGGIALILSFLIFLGNDSPAYFNHPDAVYLTLFALLNLLIAPSTTRTLPHAWLLGLTSALLISSVILQSLILLAPLPAIGGQPAIWLSLLLASLGVLTHLIHKMGFNARHHARQHTPSDHTDNREAGTVKWFNTSKGFGFISRDTGEDIFVHFRAIRGEGHRILNEGQRVEFNVIQRDKGLQAEDVTTTSSER